MATQVELTLDQALFSADAVMRTAQRFTGECFVDVSVAPNGDIVRLTPRDEAAGELLEERFKNEALDERLRERVRSETQELHLALVSAALKGAAPLGDR